MNNPKSKIQNPKSDALEATLRGVQRRLRVREAVSLLPFAVALGLAAGLALVVLGRFKPALDWRVLSASGVLFVAAAVLTVFAYATLRPRDLMATARRADLLLSLDERLSTALEDSQRSHDDLTPEQRLLWQAQLDDALEAASLVEPGRDLPARLERRKLLPVAAALLAVLVAAFVPLPDADFTNNGAAQAQIQNEQKQIEEMKKALQSQPTLADDPARAALLKELDELSRDLSKGDLSREQALARLSEAESKLEQKLQAQAPAQREALDQLAKQLAASSDGSVKEAGEKLREGKPNEAADALKQAGKNAGKMSQSERKDLAQSLKQARDNVASLDPELAQSLNEAAQALESGDQKATEQAMNNLSRQIEQRGQNQATQQQIQQALAQIQQSKGNVAQGQQTPMAFNGTPLAFNGTPLNGTQIAMLGTQAAMSGTPLNGTQIARLGTMLAGTPMALGSPVRAGGSGTGTPVSMLGTPGKGTPVAVPAQGQGAIPVQGQGQGQGQGQQGQGQGQGQQGALPNGGWGKGHNDPVYVPPSSVNAPSTAVAVQGQNNPNGESSNTTTNTDLNNTGPAQVPYEQVYGQYSQQAGNALGNDYIPQGYKDLVKDYFTSIDPNGP